MDQFTYSSIASLNVRIQVVIGVPYILSTSPLTASSEIDQI